MGSDDRRRGIDKTLDCLYGAQAVFCPCSALQDMSLLVLSILYNSAESSEKLPLQFWQFSALLTHDVVFRGKEP